MVAVMESEHLDAELDAVLVGGRERARIILRDYDPGWPSQFARHRDRIRTALGDRALAIEHIGSTSVPGLAAKPIIDVAVAVADVEEPGYALDLVAAGYELRVREPGHRMFRTPDRGAHIHVYSAGSQEIDDYLLLRERLRAHPEDRGRYESLKRALADREWRDMNYYAEAKTPVIADILSRARAAGGQPPRPPSSGADRPVGFLSIGEHPAPPGRSNSGRGYARSVPSSPARRGQPAIEDYAFLSDCSSAALVDRDGSIDWWCAPRFDSPSLLGRLLDPDAGHWTLHAAEEYHAERSYVGDSLVLRTIVRTGTGEVAVTDALAFERGAREHRIGLRSPHVLLRRVEGRHGRVEMISELAPRMEYGRTEPHLRPATGGVEARGGPARLTVTANVPMRCEDGAIRSRFTVAAGETVEFRVGFGSSFGEVPKVLVPDEPTIDDTVEAWESWAAQHTAYDGRFRDQVRRSAVVLQGLTYAPSGAVVAAATTSLPESLGGTDNYDYRFAWLRDLSLTTRALWVAACPDEPQRLFDWFTNAAGHIRQELVQIMYGVDGERDLTERTLEHLAGYRDSRPVRVGNAAWAQKQLDVLGEVLDAAHLLAERVDDLERPVQELMVILADRAAAGWTEPDAGMWEARDEQRHYTSSKVMCWVALDRAVRLAPRLGDGADAERWGAVRDEVHSTVVERAWSKSAGAYTGAFGSEHLDASVLLLPVVGFLPATDDRMRATIDMIERELGSGGLVRRWPSDPSGFLICTYWLVECLALAGETQRAEEWFRRATDHANDLGLLSEEADPVTGELLGNFPQAFSHVGLINAAWRLTEARSAAAEA